MNKALLMIAGVCTALFANTTAAAASTYPDHTIRMIIPFEPGGGNDIVSRLTSRYLSEMLGQPIIMDNRPGAGTIIGAQLAAKAAPDGYTLFSGNTGTMAINPSIYKSLPYDPVKDFTPIAMVAIGQNVLVVNNSLPVHSVKELIDYAHAHPGKLNFGSSGTGGAPHMAGELFKSMASVDMTHVPYKGAAPALVGLMGDSVQLMFGGLGAVIPQMKSGKVRALAVAGSTRSLALPDLPTIGETLPGFDGATWFGVFAPAHTPQPIVDKLSEDFGKIMARPDVVKQLIADGYEPYVMTSSQLGPFVAKERDKWATVVKAAHIPPQQ